MKGPDQFIISFMVGLIIWIFSISGLKAQNFQINSKDGQTQLSVSLGSELTWTVAKYGQTILPQVKIGMTVDGQQLGENPRLVSRDVFNRHESLEVVNPVKNRMVENSYMELQMQFENGFGLEFRVYNHGVAYRFLTTKPGGVRVEAEKMEVTFPDNTTSYFPQEESMYSHYERSYLFKRIDTIKSGEFASLPVLFNGENGVRVLYSEADVYDYPHMFVAGSASSTVKALFPKAVASTRPNPDSPDRNVIITGEEPFIAATRGTRTFPWRFFVISNKDAALIEQEMVLQLSRPSELEETSWIKPGKIAWDWWNANHVYGVDFKSGLNTATYKYYIDFAAQYDLEYLILDEGWTKTTTEILEWNPEIDVKELIRYGNEKGVGVILWCLWKPLDDNMEEILDTYASWGAKGVKVDFMQRADQYMVNSFTQIARECAKRKMMVDFHGAFKPAGLRKAYPNVISYEGVQGNEHNKWSTNITPEHTVTLPFIRMAVGPMDFTPGAMRNVQAKNFCISFDRPMSLGTRAHQVAMYVVYESGLQMLCDSPSAYLKDKKTVEVISRIPTTWETTKVLQAKVGDYVAVARKNGEDYYIGAMTDWSERNLELDLSFLPGGTYEATIFKDGLNANTFAEDYTVEHIEVNNSTSLTIAMAKGGGWTAILKRK